MLWHVVPIADIVLLVFFCFLYVLLLFQTQHILAEADSIVKSGFLLFPLHIEQIGPIYQSQATKIHPPGLPKVLSQRCCHRP